MVLKDPENTDNYLVRRLAATEGFEMVSKDEKEEPFILDKDECWVLADNEALKPKVLPFPIHLKQTVLLAQKLASAFSRTEFELFRPDL